MEAPKQKPTSDSKAFEKPSQAKDASVPVNHLIWKGQKLPCLVRAAVFQNGLAAGVGIKSLDDGFLTGLFNDADTEALIRDLVYKQMQAELSAREITSGILEEEILGAIDDFVQAVKAGTGVMGTRKVAEGQPPQPGTDGKLVYVLHANKEPLYRMMLADRKLAAGKVHRVKPGDVLVEHLPPEAGTEGSDVRGEVVPVTPPHDVSLDKVRGPNVDVKGEQIVAAIEGVYFEDDQGRVQVIQEVVTQEVNAATGNLPRTGVATSHFWIEKGVRQGGGVFTTGDVFIGRVGTPAPVDKNTQIHARHLIVNGQVVGAGVPKEFLNGETDALEESAQVKIRNTLAQSQIEVQGICAAHEVMGRHVVAEHILIGSRCFMSSLDAGGDIRIAGNLVGGVTTFEGRLQVMGDLGNVQNAQTRIRIGGQPRADAQKARLDQRLVTAKTDLEKATERLDAFAETMEQKGKKSVYWQALMQGEKRVPQGPTERALLMAFAKAVKELGTLERAVSDGKREIEDLAQMQAGVETGSENAQEPLSVVVRGVVHEGVAFERIVPLEASDLETHVHLRGKEDGPVALQELKRALTQEVANYIEPQKERIAAQEEALEKMFQDRENKPTAATLVNRRFEVGFQFMPEDDETNTVVTLPERGVLYVYALEPQSFYLKHIWRVREPLKNVCLTVLREGPRCSVTYAQNETVPTAWRVDPAVVEQLEVIEIQQTSARMLLFGKGNRR